MKAILPALTALTILLISCEGRPKSTAQDNELLSTFIENPGNLKDVEVKSPIEKIKTAAEESAVKVVALTKDNVEEVLEEAKEHSHVLISTGDHTLVLIDDMEDCKTSGSWEACMPHAEGYIQRGGLEYQDDYINNIIGKPDEQERLVFFFD